MQQNDKKMSSEDRDPVYSAFITKIKNQCGVSLLSDEELVALAFDEISRTFTRDERNYS